MSDAAPTKRRGGKREKRRISAVQASLDSGAITRGNFRGSKSLEGYIIRTLSEDEEERTAVPDVPDTAVPDTAVPEPAVPTPPVTAFLSA